MDPLSQICSAIQVRSVLYTRVEAAAPWGVASPGEAGVKFVLLVRGDCILKMDGVAAPIAMRGGDVFITLGPTPYEIYDAPDSALLDCAEVMAKLSGNTIVLGGAGAASVFLSGIFELDASDATPLLSVLPPFLLLRSEDRRCGAFEATLGMLAGESAGHELGADALIGRLFEILFIHAIRAYCRQQPTLAGGWLAVLSDPPLKQVAHAMHADLGRAWTLDMLAQQAGMSRTSFATRFKDKAGQTPQDYLARWRMHRAAQLIRAGRLSLAQIGRTVGYHSEAAFSRMFTREIGVAPGRYRKTAQLSE